MGKGSRPRPFSVSQEEFGNKMDGIFGKKPARAQYIPPPLPDENAKQDVAKNKCGCYNCMKTQIGDNGWPLTASTFIVCPNCGNKRCPKATDHNLDCTNSNESGQPGSRYE